jgi:hypothetical protein
MLRRTRRSGWSASRKERSGEGATQTLAAISLTDTPISLGGDRAFIGARLIGAGSRVARLAAALLAALVFVLLTASLARAAAPQALTALTPSFVTAGAGTARVVVSPDGKSVYATNKSAATLSQYARNAVTGVLTALSPTSVETGEMPEGVTVSPDGTSVTPPTPPPSQGVLPSQESKAPPVPNAKLTSTSLTVSPSGSVSSKIACPTGESSCTGTVVLQTLTAVSAATTGHQSKHKPAVLMLASGSFTIAGGQVKVVTLHLSGKARTLLAHAHVLRVRATVTARDPAGAKHTVHTIVTLRAPKATRHH